MITIPALPCPIRARGTAIAFLRTRRVVRAAVLFSASLLTAGGAHAADVADTFGAYAAGSKIVIDHSAWDGLLKTYVKPGADGLNRVDYKAFKNAGWNKLKAYVRQLEQSDVAALDRAEQMAFWANLYNAKTIDVVLEHYPVDTIRDIDISGLFSNGPWGKKITRVKGVDLSLDDIEHGIMRPVFRDPRVHYAVNCASVGCPNLGTAAFTGANLDAQLDTGARAFINSPRGALFKGDRLIVSSIYSWFQEDFGGSEAGVIRHLAKYAAPDLAGRLSRVKDIYDDQYDWSLNDVAQ